MPSFRPFPALPAAVLLTVFTSLEAADKTAWPREIKAEEGRILVYQPQPDGYEGNILDGRAAVSIKLKTKPEPVFGTVWFRARVDVDREHRTIQYADVTIPKSRFPGSTPESEQKLAALIEEEVPKWEFDDSLDRLIATLKMVEKEKKYAEGFNTRPPRILIEKSPTVLVLLDGQPILRDVPDFKTLKRVVNTPYFLVFDGTAYYLNGSATWFTTPDLNGEWEAIKKPSKEVAKYYEKLQAPKKGEQPPKPPKDNGKKPPRIIVSTQPAELIVLEGEPKYAPITGTDLHYVTNTESNIILDVPSQDTFVLISGRWYRGKGLKDPWELVKATDLPADFKKIPPSSPAGEVLASVAGTEEAEDALMDAQVPQTAAIRRDQAKAKVEYDGAPKFEKASESVEYAVNTTSQVLRIKSKYYLCDQAVWYVADAPDGPWIVADQVPPEVQQIPPDKPVYNTKYVQVYDSNPEVVYVGYLPGYVGCYPYYGTVVWGTGWYYPPYVSPYVYYPYPVTFGFAAHYNPYYGWSLGFSVGYGPFMFSFWGAGYGGYYGGYYGPVYRPPYYGGGGGAIVRPPGNYHPGARPTPYGTNSNVYNRAENRGHTASTMDKSTRPQAKSAAGASNNLYSDRSGNVYRRDGSGSWQTREGGSWKGSGNSGLNRDYTARQQGSQRSQGYRGGYGGGYRGGGGRGGGGRR